MFRSMLFSGHLLAALQDGLPGKGGEGLEDAESSHAGAMGRRQSLAIELLSSKEKVEIRVGGKV